ncbi:hypothetical protein N3Z17_02940 [Candidatus Bandiella numerosa]|uniref:hypothetical protein n=1 Tax=Candidatus Bandiella numerosa TaxID=2570586 RepID=UPI00249EDDF0|nr:hypothetical protein [Candidatus Bandiella numerosa]WHA05480.1 hypothetical protein N3Z17_02940 [Candidatus Bandiella numerosa]
MSLDFKFEETASISILLYKMKGVIISPIGIDFVHSSLTKSSIIVTIGILAMQAIAISLIFEEFFPFSYKYQYKLGIILGTLYSLFRGIKAVSLTDFSNFLLSKSFRETYQKPNL